MSTMPRVGIAVAPDLPNYGLSQHLSENYAAAFRRLGFDVLIVAIEPDDPQSVERLLEPDIGLLFSHGGWLMSPQGPLGDAIGAVLRDADKPMIALIADPPYSPWLPEIFANLPPRAATFLIDPNFARGVSHWTPSGLHPPYLPCGHMLDGHGPVRTRDKTIPLLFVGTLEHFPIILGHTLS